MENELKTVSYKICFLHNGMDIYSYSSLTPPFLKVGEFVSLPSDDIDNGQMPFTITDIETCLTEVEGNIVYVVTYSVKDFNRDELYFKKDVFIDFIGNCIRPGKHNSDAAFNEMKDIIEGADLIIYSGDEMKYYYKFDKLGISYYCQMVKTDRCNNIGLIFKKEPIELDAIVNLLNSDYNEINTRSEFFIFNKLLPVD